jgi:hypothetical protein
MRSTLKILLVLSITLKSIGLFGQEISVYGGLNYNSFYDLQGKTPHYNSSYKPDLGFSAGIGLDSIRVDWIAFNFTLQLEKYGGEVKASDSGLGGGSSINMITDKWVISLGIFPLNFQLFNRIEISFGLELSRLLYESYEGTISGWTIEPSYWSSNVEDFYSEYNRKSYIGIKGRIVYDFNLSNSIMISPQYSFYFGLNSEFLERPDNAKSMRHYLCIAVKKKIK